MVDSDVVGSPSKPRPLQHPKPYPSSTDAGDAKEEQPARRVLSRKMPTPLVEIAQHTFHLAAPSASLLAFFLLLLLFATCPVLRRQVLRATCHHTTDLSPLRTDYPTLR